MTLTSQLCGAPIRKRILPIDAGSHPQSVAPHSP